MTESSESWMLAQIGKIRFAKTAKEILANAKRAGIVFSSAVDELLRIRANGADDPGLQPTPTPSYPARGMAPPEKLDGIPIDVAGKPR